MRLLQANSKDYEFVKSTLETEKFPNSKVQQH
jgi:hypothetical protein